MVPTDSDRCTCGGEDSDGRGDVLRCPVHGIGEVTFTVCGDVPWEEMTPETQGAIRAVAQAAARFMSAEEIAEHERCKQSVIDARRSAESNEGQRYIP